MADPTKIPVTRGAIRRRSGALLGARTEHGKDGAVVLAAQSQDTGKTWSAPVLVVRDPDRTTDLGDGAFLESARHGLLYVCRHNHHEKKSYAIEVYQSTDSGKSWKAHSSVTSHTVTEPGGPSRGLWAPFLFETPGGRLLCIYDDENTPFLRGFVGHQWLMGRFWDTKNKTWGEPVVVCRAEGRELSRDGMGTIVSVGKRLVCALESVATELPHPGVIRVVTSDDDGQTWAPRRLLFQAPQRPHMALSPFLAKRTDGTLACIFGTDEAQETPDKPGTPAPKLHLDIKLSLSHDGGASWSKPELLFSGGHRNYLPGLIALPKNQLFACWLNFAQDALLGVVWGSSVS